MPFFTTNIRYFFDLRTRPFWMSPAQFIRILMSGSLNPTLNQCLVRVNGIWVLDQFRYYVAVGVPARLIARHAITALVAQSQVKGLIGVLDIETFVHKGRLLPYAVGLAYLVDGTITLKTFYIQKRTGNLQSIEERSSALLNRVCEHIKLNLKDYTLYAHNMGKFDGYLILKPLLHCFGPYQLLLDKSRAIICLKLPGNITLKDSYRILPHSLADLGLIFNTSHRKLEFDHSKASIQTIYLETFRKDVLKYLDNDLLCLLEIVTMSSEMILKTFNVDLNDCYSASSLAFRIYRTNFMQTDSIPTLPLWLDNLIRQSYRGGSVDVYSVRGNCAYYYDVNSLYPYAMCHPIPYEYKGFRFAPVLDNFFGFVMAQIYIPEGTKVPIVGVRSPEGSLYYPTGHVKALFFSEELKAFKRQGYSVFCLYGYEFSKADLFSEYVNTLYEMKSNSTGAKRNFVKLLLNGLYGYFGRNLNTISATFFKDIPNLYSTHKVLETLTIEDFLLVVHETLPNRELCEKNKISYSKLLRMTLSRNLLLANVAIASAITSYARIHMMQFKSIPGNPPLYTDTDSVFLSKPLNPDLVDSKMLGFIKDELNGDTITDYMFLEPKLYYYITSEGKIVFKARGVPRGLMTYEIMEQLWKGGSVEFSCERLYKSLPRITISSKVVKETLTRQYDRKVPVFDDQHNLVGYSPKHISFLEFMRNKSK